MGATGNGRWVGARRRGLRVAALTLALTALPPLQLVAGTGDGEDRRVPAVTWQVHMAEAGVIEPIDLRDLPSYRGNEGDTADWRIRAGFLLLLLSGLGAVTARLWAGALRRPS